MNLPNALTVLRVLLTGVVLWCMLLPGLAPKAWALGLFMIAAWTDWLDGYLARRLNLITPMGALWDPIADKLLVLGLLTVFAVQAIVPAWMVIVIAARELLVTLTRLYVARRRLVIPAAKEGKQKAALQMLTIWLILIWQLLIASGKGGGALPGLQVAIWVGLWGTVALTLWSGAKFFWAHRAVFGAVSGGSSPPTGPSAPSGSPASRGPGPGRDA